MRRSAPTVVAILGLLTSLSLAACTGGSGDDTGKSTGASTLTVWTFKQSHVKALETIGATWGKKDGVTVKVQAITPDDAFKTRVRAAAKTNDLPDILMAHTAGEEWEFAQAGILEDLTDDFDTTWQGEMQEAAVKSAGLSQARIDGAAADPTKSLSNLKAGHWYGIPQLSGSPGVVFARKSKLQQAGVDTSTPPATWEDWVAAMKKTIAADAQKGGLVTGLQVAPTGYFWTYRPMANAYLGHDAFTSRQSRSPSPAWSDAESVKTLELYDQLTPLWKPGVLALGIDQADQAFASGDAAWDVGGTFTLPFLRQQGVEASDLMAFPVPAPQGGKIAKTTLAPSALISAGVTTKAANRKQAVDFLRYLTGKDGATAFLDLAQDLPTAKLAAGEVDDPLLAALVRLFESSDNAFEINDFSADPGGGTLPITTQTADVLNKLVAKKSDPAAVGNELAAAYKAAWAKQG